MSDSSLLRNGLDSFYIASTTAGATRFLLGPFDERAVAQIALGQSKDLLLDQGEDLRMAGLTVERVAGRHKNLPTGEFNTLIIDALSQPFTIHPTTPGGQHG